LREYGVAVIGASGYTGGELLRIIAQHPYMDLAVATSREFKWRPIHSVHYNLRGFFRGMRFTEYEIDKVSNVADIAFLSVPHGQSVRYVPELLDVGLRVVDLSADFRLKDPEMYRVWYGFTHPYPDLLRKAVYGLPELHRSELRGANLISSPGCNSTAVILASAPLVRYGLLTTNLIIADVKVGSSEAGSKASPSTHHPEREGGIRPYSVNGHRHVAEVLQELNLLAGREFRVSLTPHAVSNVRGTFATVYGSVRDGLQEIDVFQKYVEMYGSERFVRLVYGTPLRSPNVKYVVGSNFADVSVAVEEGSGVVKGFTAIDNLVKGAAGQAVQALNIALGLDEGAGLWIPPLKPV
jgi:N-acetyl-gamma-glutamyl-phosphate/LysW-gamma-L-alpha-aminoadipyl-6-phosphate reductase